MNRVLVNVVVIGMVSFFLATASLLISETKHESDNTPQVYELSTLNNRNVENEASVSRRHTEAGAAVASPGETVSATVEGLAREERNLTLRSEMGEVITMQVPAAFLRHLHIGEVVKVNMQGQRVTMIYTQRHGTPPELPHGS